MIGMKACATFLSQLFNRDTWSTRHRHLSELTPAMCKSYVYYAYNARLECELHVACMEHETLESYVFGRATSTDMQITQVQNSGSWHFIRNQCDPSETLATWISLKSSETMSEL